MSKEDIANARNETTWNKFWGQIESIEEAVDITKLRTVSIQRHQSNAGHDQRQSPKDYFLVNVPELIFFKKIKLDVSVKLNKGI